MKTSHIAHISLVMSGYTIVYSVGEGSCAMAGYSSCCSIGLSSANCTGVPSTCYCDELCYKYRDCCGDIEDSCDASGVVIMFERIG